VVGAGDSGDPDGNTRAGDQIAASYLRKGCACFGYLRRDSMAGSFMILLPFFHLHGRPKVRQPFRADLRFGDGRLTLFRGARDE